MPKHWLTEDGPRPDLATEFGLVESHFEGYDHRTRHNIRNSDGTVIFIMGSLDGGSYLTREYADRIGRPVVVIAHGPHGFRPLPAALRRWLSTHAVKIANIAGNRESKSPGIGALVEAYVLDVLTPPELPGGVK